MAVAGGLSSITFVYRSALGERIELWECLGNREPCGKANSGNERAVKGKDCVMAFTEDSARGENFAHALEICLAVNVGESC